MHLVTGLLQIVFITLKLCHVINWAWWQVLLPIEIQAGIWLVLVLIGVGILLIHKYL